MKLLIDTNVILDVLLHREVFFDNSFSVMQLIEKDDFEGYISASSITDIFYIVNKKLKDKELVISLLKDILTIVEIQGVNRQEIFSALALGWDDFEDAVQYSTAVFADMDCIITRNKSDFSMSKIPVYTPKEALEEFSNQL